MKIYRKNLGLDLNFWPSFADLMLAITLILFLVIIVSYAVIKYGVDLKNVKDSQESMRSTLKSEFGDDLEKSGVEVEDGAETQIVKFSSNILFSQDDTTLNAQGIKVLNYFGRALGKNINRIRRIQIEGHADVQRTKKFSSNMALAALRANTVFNFLTSKGYIDPNKDLTSIISFGEYKPVSRIESDTSYNQAKIIEANRTSLEKQKNRRIEILLFYRLKI